MAVAKTNPLTHNVPIADNNGRPTPEFMRKWDQQQFVNAHVPTTATELSALLDLFGSVTGSIIYRSATGWVVRLPGNADDVLTIDAGLPVWKPNSAAGGPVGFGFNIEGVLADGETLGAGLYAVDMLFSDADAQTVVEALLPAAATAVLSLRIPDDTEVGTVTFAAGALTATVAWTGAAYTLPASTVLRLLVPGTADAALGYITGTVHGSPA